MTYSIGELARAAAVPVSTVRYYERIGILNAAHRTDSGYRQYGKPELERLHFIRMAQSLGFTLDDAVVLLKLRQEEPAPQDKVDALISHRLELVEGQIRHLREIKCLMETALGRRDNACACARCQTLSEFQERFWENSSANA